MFCASVPLRAIYCFAFGGVSASAFFFPQRASAPTCPNAIRSSGVLAAWQFWPPFLPILAYHFLGGLVLILSNYIDAGQSSMKAWE